MTDKFSTISIEKLFKIFESSRNLESFGLTDNLKFKGNELLEGVFMGKKLSTPFGVAAGPHTQMAQNIIMAFLSGAMYIELKTIQVLDELEIPKPCIDMADEGYNCEWSQELKIEESFNEYLNAWIMLHIINYRQNGNSKKPGFIFNMSVGYNYEGILNPKVQWFLDKMKNCKIEKEQKIQLLRTLCPEITNIQIPDCISDNVTLSTMHGCPPDEIEKITRYLIEVRKLNTILKLNPTLLGKEAVREILNKTFSYDTIVPDEAFEHDLKYPQALDIIKKLIVSAQQNNVFFGVKLTNTLESLNNRDVFSKEQPSMYMSGRALHPISINVAHKLQKDFNGSLNVSFSAGADCFNIADVISCGFFPVTVSSDILKPGGYSRLFHYASEIEKAFNQINAQSIEDFIIKKTNKNNNIQESALNNLESYAQNVLKNKMYKKETFFDKSIKTNKELGAFDCISAPCMHTCPTHQDIPEYLYYASVGNFNEAFKTILRTNPFPNVLGMVCDHKCQTRCTRINYDEDLHIRDVKWFISEKNDNGFINEVLPLNGTKAAIIGAGPSGLSCAYFLRLSGVDVTVYESKNIPGGMVSEAIPLFRLKEKALQMDIDRIKRLGVHIHYNVKIDNKSFDKLKKEFNFIYIAVGAQNIKKLNIEGENAQGVLDPIAFLSALKKNTLEFNGKNIAVIGGGNTAMDVARAASRLVKGNGKVTLIYRRSIKEMPAEKEEIEALMAEGIPVLELTQPLKVNTENNKITGITCLKMTLGEKDESGRAKTMAIRGSEFVLPFDTVIPALGQDINIDFIEKNELMKILAHNTASNTVFIGGEALRGASTIVNAMADGKNAAYNILKNIKGTYPVKKELPKEVSYDELMYKRSDRAFSNLNKITLGKFETIAPEIPFTEKEIIEEAGRCLLCNQLCNICVTVCPNKANYSYETGPLSFTLPVVSFNDGKAVFKNDRTFSIAQKYQVLNIGDFCNECGNCNTFCPTSGAPYLKKPKFYLTTESFNEAPRGYFISRQQDKIAIVYKNDNLFNSLTQKNETFVYETEEITAIFKKDDFSLININSLLPELKEISLENAAEMRVLLDAALGLY